MESPVRRPGPWGRVVVGPRGGTLRDRRGRGRRGVLALPGPLSPRGIPARETRGDRFEQLVTRIVDALAPAFRAESDRVEIVVEDAPRLPAEWDDAVPSSVITRTATSTRVVLFRLPITHHAHDDAQLEDLTWRVVLDQLASIWQVSPDDLDPR